MLKTSPHFSRRQLLSASIGIGAAVALGTSAYSPSLQWRERALHGFGTTLWLRAGHSQVSILDQALDAAIAAIRTIEAQMSLFDSHSSISQLNAAGYLADAPRELVEILRFAKNVSAKSQGAFDVTVQPLWLAWQRANAAARLPTEAELDEARGLIGWQNIRIDHETISFAKLGMQMTLNGIAQGFAADFAKGVLQRHGIEHALINTGEWSALGRAPDQKPWAIGLADPHKVKSLLASIVTDGDSIATSTDEHCTFTADRRYHHILDPKTGSSPSDIALVTVATPSCALADALTKVIFMAGADEAISIAQQWNVKAVVVDKFGAMQSTRGTKQA